jgi:hypothetical protein
VAFLCFVFFLGDLKMRFLILIFLASCAHNESVTKEEYELFQARFSGIYSRLDQCEFEIRELKNIIAEHD